MCEGLLEQHPILQRITDYPCQSLEETGIN